MLVLGGLAEWMGLAGSFVRGLGVGVGVGVEVDPTVRWTLGAGNAMCF